MFLKVGPKKNVAPRIGKATRGRRRGVRHSRSFLLKTVKGSVFGGKVTAFDLCRCLCQEKIKALLPTKGPALGCAAAHKGRGALRAPRPLCAGAQKKAGPSCRKLCLYFLSAQAAAQVKSGAFSAKSCAFDGCQYQSPQKESCIFTPPGPPGGPT